MELLFFLVADRNEPKLGAECEELEDLKQAHVGPNLLVVDLDAGVLDVIMRGDFAEHGGLEVS